MSLRCYIAAYFLMIPLLPAASFDCAKARTPTEKLICSDPTLSKADERMAAAYTKALALASQSGAEDAKELKLDQRAWLEETPSTGGAAPLLDAYKKRTAFLDYYASHASASAASATGTYEYTKTNFCTYCEPGRKSGVTQTGTLEINQVSKSEAAFSLEIGNTARGGVGSIDGRASMKNGVLTFHTDDGAIRCNLNVRFTKTAAVIEQGDGDCGFRMGTDASGMYIKRSDSVTTTAK